MAQNDEASFALALEDGMSGAAESAAHALETLRARMDDDSKALTQLNKAMRNLKPGGDAMAAQMKKIKVEIELKRQAIAKAQSSITQLGGTLDKTAKKGRAFSDISKYAREMPGPVAQLSRAFEFVTKSVSGTTIALVATAAAVALGAAAIIKATASLLHYALAQQNARRSELLRLEGLTKLRTYMSMYYGLEHGNAGDMQKDIDRVAASSSLSRDKIAGFGDELYRMGLRGKNYSAALEGMSMKAAVHGDAVAHMWAGWAQYTALAGGSVERLAQRVKNQIGGIAKKQMLDADVQAMKLQESFGALTNSIKIEDLLQAKKEFNDLFGQSTASGRRLQTLLGKLLQPLIDATVSATHVMKIFFQDLIIGELQIEIAYYRLLLAATKAFSGIKSWLKNATSSADKFFETMESGTGLTIALLTILAVRTISKLVIPAMIRMGEQVVWTAVKLVANLVPASLAAATSLGTLGIVTGILLVQFLTIAAVVGLALAALWGLAKIGQLVYTIWKEIDWTDVGRDIVNGLVNGIGKAEMKFFDAIGDLATGAWKRITDVFGIHSPSLLMARVGVEIPKGLAVGIKQAAPESDAAIQALAPRVPAIPAQQAQQAGRNMGARAGGGGGGGTITIANLTVNASGGDAQSVAQDIKAELERLLEGVAIQMGAGAPA